MHLLKELTVPLTTYSAFLRSIFLAIATNPFFLPLQSIVVYGSLTIVGTYAHNQRLNARSFFLFHQDKEKMISLRKG